MHLPKERIAYLLEAFVAGKATAAEEQELMEWLHDAPDDADFKTYVQNLWSNHRPNAVTQAVDWDAMFNRVVAADAPPAINTRHPIKPAWWPRMAVAAAILLLVTAGVFWLLAPQSIQTPVAASEQQPPAKDLAPPAINKATLTLANGKVIMLDSAAIGSLAGQGIVNASKLNDGELAYVPTAANVQWQTLRVPKGSKPMHLQLADGSGVWLNAASAITFPNLFAGNERKVAVTGEVYFEVTHDANSPFIVTNGAMAVQVLGTKFNVNAYDNEDNIRVTLLEGSVKLRNGNKEALLKPGQQAKLTGQNLTVQSGVNIDEVMAWKNGLFEFNETDIQTIMRQMERWYDVEIVYAEPVVQHFNGTIPRQVNASDVLDMLGKTGGVRFSIKGKKITVKKF